MIVYAIEMGYRKIRFYGVDMALIDEYQTEKGGIEYWLGYARGIGKEVWIAEGSTLLRTVTGKPYGIKYFKMSEIDPYGLLKKRKYRKLSALEKLRISRTQGFKKEVKELDAIEAEKKKPSIIRWWHRIVKKLRYWCENNCPCHCKNKVNTPTK